ncbi:MAG: hypothetical protein HN948_08805 [Clostridia bacterium]|jgi:hypothetical protein|nr:hypothetical protein [Clostridia bacterium]MBT7123089.1 hypothetical protein [Clostridia bacterium]
MKLCFFPKTKLGKWSLICILVAILSAIIVLATIAIFDIKGGNTFFSTPALAIPLVLAWLLGFASFLIGLIAIIKSKPRSVLVFIASTLGLLIAVYGLAEVIFPH